LAELNKTLKEDKLTIWTFTSKEIGDLKFDFEKIFGEELNRDYENIWEWIWNGPTSENKINISREHNMKYGEYEKPLRIILDWQSKEIYRTEIIGKIQAVLRTKIFIGKITNSGRNKDDYIIKEIKEYEL